MANNPVVGKLRTKVEAFKNTLPVAQALRNSALRYRHYAKIEELIGQNLEKADDDFTLGKLLDMNVDAHVEEIRVRNIETDKKTKIKREKRRMVALASGKRVERLSKKSMRIRRKETENNHKRRTKSGREQRRRTVKSQKSIYSISSFGQAQLRQGTQHEFF